MTTVLLPIVHYNSKIKPVQLSLQFFSFDTTAKSWQKLIIHSLKKNTHTHTQARIKSLTYRVFNTRHRKNIKVYRQVPKKKIQESTCSNNPSHVYEHLYI